jgi:NIMA (never in mitosis gene a)-related kinase
LDEREKALMVREGQIATREAACVTKEGENMETQAKLNTAAEQLRTHWDKLRIEKERMSEGSGLDVGEERPVVRRVSTAPIAPAPTRPTLEERPTAPLPMVSRLPRHPAWEDTPSKIPVAIATASPVPLERLPAAGQATPLRRANTKSLGNMYAAYKGEATPAKQTIPQPGRQRTSIGSPSELYYNEDITMASMASPALSVLASPAPFIPRPRRSYAAPTGTLASHSSGSLASGSSSESISSHEQENIPPTMIPAPTTFVYREAATPAKWAMEDPDLPSPFLRRLPTAPPAIPAERQPLGGISLQPTAHATLSSAPTNVKPSGMIVPGGIAPKKSSMPAIPRSRSGNLHQHVLRANAHARTSGEGVRSRPGTSTARTYG